MLQWIKKISAKKTKTITLVERILVIVFCFSVTFSSAHAQIITSTGSGNSAANTVNAGLNPLQASSGLSGRDLPSIAGGVIKGALGVLGIIVVGMIVYAGFLWVTSQGNEEQISKAKKILVNGTIGVIIIFSAYAIASFIFKLSNGVNTVSEGGGSGLEAQNFQGSGALGGIIKDHYPTRDQVGVPRNSKIIITFRKAIKPDSFIVNNNQSQDANGNAIFGDCVNVGEKMDWKKDCDSLTLDDDHISIKRADTGEKITGASVVAQYQNGKLYTVVLRPFDYLGSNASNVPYKVRIGKAVLLDDQANNNPSIFKVKSFGNDYYEWSFTCSTELDVAPPYVKNVFPEDGTKEARNSVIQIDFSEPMDPTGVQGSFHVDGNVYALEGGNIFLKAGKSTVPLGDFSLTNGYRTLEFTPSQECGTNSCGGKIFCLPVCDNAAAGCTEDTYSLLVKAAKTFSVSSFESIPFSGAMDVSGNALDGNKNNKVDSAPTVGAIFTDQRKPDNFFWDFVVTNQIDATAPYLRQVVPGLDAQNVAPASDLKMIFNKRMRVDPLYDVLIEEQPAQKIPLCKVPSIYFNSDKTTDVTLNHCPFVNSSRLYYFPVLTSDIQDVHFNCFYPGKGPGGSSEVGAHRAVSSVCDDAGKNCCSVDQITGRSFCCNGAVDAKNGQKETCLENLRANSF